MRLLGGAGVEGPGGPLTGRITQRRRLAVLALLAASPSRTLSRDKAIAYLWPESDAASARHLLSVCVYDLRKALGDDAVVAAGDDLQLGPAVASDVGELRDALARGDHGRAVACYGGPFLDGFFVGGAPQLEAWIAETRASLERAYAGALDALAAECAARGDHRGSVEALRRHAALDPLDSGVALALMRALAAADMPAAAVRHAEVHTRLLHDECGVAPSPAVTQLAERLKRGEPRHDDAAPAAAVAPVAKPLVAATAAPQARRWRRARVAAVVALVAVLSSGAVVLARERRGAPAVVAVLPFEDLGSAHTDAYFGDGIAEELITALGRIGGLRVVARSSSFALRGRSVDARDVGRRLGAGMMLDGSVRRSGDRVRITAELVSTTTGYQLWADSYDRSARDVLAVQEEIARGIVGALRVRLRAEESVRLSRRATADPEAHALYLEGRYVAAQRTPASVAQAVSYFQQAIARDPTYAEAYAGLADAYTLLGYTGAVPQAETQPRARAAAARALALDETLAEAHTALGYVRQSARDYAGADAAYRRAIALQPSDAPAHHWLGYLLVLLGHAHEGLAELRLAARLDPLSLPIGLALGQALIYTGDYDGAVRHLQAQLVLHPGHPDLLQRLGAAYGEQGRYAEAIATLHQALGAKPGDPGALATLAAAYARSGRRDSALALLDSLRTRREGRARIYTAGLMMVLGRRDEGFRALEDVYATEPSWLTSMRVEPWLASVRADRHYASLVARMGLPAASR